MSIIKIATRQSPLALWQAEEVSRQLKTIHPNLEVELIKITTKADKFLDTSLSKIGGKGLFVKELETALLNKQADIAVHSMKDVPMEFPEGLQLCVIMQREDPRDVFVSNKYKSLAEMPEGACVGTSSLRRRAQLAARFPQYDIQELRGNVGTRLSKLDDGQYDGIILAAAGLKRLGLEERMTQLLSPEESLPAIGQGAIGIECRVNDPDIENLIKPLNHLATNITVTAERALNEKLHGGCHVPVAGFAEYESTDTLRIRGLVGDVNGHTIVQDEVHGSVNDATILGETLAKQLLQQGAAEILSAFS